MNRIDHLFKTKKSNILSVYFTAGFPALQDTVPIIQSLEKNGVDLIEIGMPFSDPLADGPVIQKSSEIALQNGMSIKLLFEQLQDIRKQVSIPLILMGCINPILHYGINKFCREATEIGIDGMIIPDLPFDLYLDEYETIFTQYQLHNIFLITPQTSTERLKRIVQHSHGFLYMVSSAATTGAKTNISAMQIQYFKRIQQMKLPLPKLIGFGISNRETFDHACQYAEGTIIGSAFIKALENEGSIDKKIQEFINTIL